MNEGNQSSLKTDNWLSISEAAKYLRVSKDTLRRWERQKILKSYRSPTNRRYYRKRDLEYVFSQKPELSEKPTQYLPSPRQTPLPLVIIILLTTYIILMIFLAWLLLQTT